MRARNDAAGDQSGNQPYPITVPAGSDARSPMSTFSLWAADSVLRAFRNFPGLARRKGPRRPPGPVGHGRPRRRGRSRCDGIGPSGSRVHQTPQSRQPCRARERRRTPGLTGPGVRIPEEVQVRQSRGVQRRRATAAARKLRGQASERNAVSAIATKAMQETMAAAAPRALP